MFGWNVLGRNVNVSKDGMSFVNRRNLPKTKFAQTCQNQIFFELDEPADRRCKFQSVPQLEDNGIGPYVLLLNLTKHICKLK